MNNKTKKFSQIHKTSQTGSATIYLTILGTLFLAIIFGTTIFLQIIVGSYKAAHAADLAAIAAADTLNEINVGTPCDVAQQIVQQFGGVMVSCQLLGDSVIVETSMEVWNKRFQAYAISKAGQPK